VNRAFSLLASLVLVGAVASPAQAEPSGARPQKITIVAGPAAGFVGTSTQSAVTCTIAIYNPHKSTHVPGTINVVATIICSSIVASLDLDIYLYRGSTLVGDGSTSNEARSAVQANAYSGCTSGYYHGEAFGFIIYPAGYTPWADGGWVYSNSVYIACP
jgi:hypothetical protein